MNDRLSLQDLIDFLAKEQEITKKDAESFLRELIAVVSETIEQNEPVKIKEFGTFKLVKVSARRSVDVNTGEAIEIAPHYKLSFVPDKSLKEAVNRPFAHFESVVLEDGVSFDNIEHENENEAPIQTPVVIAREPETEDITPQPETTSPHIEENPEPEGPYITDTEIIPVVNENKETATDNPEITATTVIDEEQMSTDVQKDKRKRASKKRRKLFSLGFFIFLIVAGFSIGGLYFQEIAEFITYGPENETNVATKIANSEIIKTDAIPEPVPDSLIHSDPVVIDSLPDIQPTEPLATETIRSGHTLRNISLRYYGHKSFWIYIYEENKDVISNPNNVPIGTRLVIPAPQKYGIDSWNQESVNAAVSKEQKLFKELGI